MNELVLKRVTIFSLILGATIGLVSLIPPMIGICLFILSFFSSVIVMSYMRAKENFFSLIDVQQGATIGGIIGFFSGVGFFISFSPMVTILHLIFKGYYSYAIPDMLRDVFWLFLIIVFMVSLMFAMTNAASAMGVAFVIGRLKNKPEDYDKPLDIEIND